MAKGKLQVTGLCRPTGSFSEEKKYPPFLPIRLEITPKFGWSFLDIGLEHYEQVLIKSIEKDSGYHILVYSTSMQFLGFVHIITYCQRMLSCGIPKSKIR
jgi:hypothetical protein